MQPFTGGNGKSKRDATVAKNGIGVRLVIAIPLDWQGRVSSFFSISLIVLLLVLLTAKEMARGGGGSAACRRMRVLNAGIVPLLIVFFILVVKRILPILGVV